ncbi:MAG: hypothetical protein MI974_31805 [Chitinophagales bacterium]|nr:hypothetical protein [Chitinophagales bacterium]
MKKTSELLWQGNVHMGDQPGTFGNANYSGICFELPFMLESSIGTKQEVSISIITDLVKVYTGYTGHKVTISRYELNTGSPNPYDWKRVIIKETYIDDDNIKKIDFEVQGVTVFLSCKIEVDTTTAPGLYDEFLIKEFRFKSDDYLYSASLGFKYKI